MKRLILIVVLLATACNATPYWKETTPVVETETVSPPVVSTETPEPQPTLATLRRSSPVEYTVTGNANVREFADAESKVIGYLYTGDIVQVISCDGDWCSLTTGGYVFSPCLGFDGVCR